ncbi:hypothetical protein Tco_0549569 [Tanacetum coccineum]
MSSPKFAETHNVVAFLEKPVEVIWVYWICDFLKASSVHYALTVNPIIYTSCIEQFWATTNVKMVNRVRQLQALIDKKKMIITESNIRNNLHLEDAEASDDVGEDSDPLNDSNHLPIVDHHYILSNPRRKKVQRKQRKEAEVAHDEAEHEESVPTPSNDPQPSEKAKSDQAIKIASLKKRVDKQENRRKFITIGLKRLKNVGAARRIKSSNDSLGTQKDVSKQGRIIEYIDEDVEYDDEVFVDVTTVEKEEQSTKTGEAVTTAGVEDSVAPTIPITAGVEDSAAPTIPTTVEETLAQTLMEIKAAKPKAKGIVFHDLEKQVSKPTVFVTQPSIKDKGKGIMQEPERPLTKKYQVALDEDLARNIQAQLDAKIIEEERLERQKQEEANIALIESWENTQAMMEADRLLAERLQTREREELTDEEKGKLFMELMEKKKKTFYCTKSTGKEKTYSYQELFDKEINRVNTFMAMSSKAQESNEKKVEGSEEKAKSNRKKESGREEQADGSSKRYSSMIRMLQDIDRKDLETLWKLVKTKHGDLRLEDEHERVL